jgi:hypothetical protein
VVRLVVTNCVVETNRGIFADGLVPLHIDLDVKMSTGCWKRETAMEMATCLSLVCLHIPAVVGCAWRRSIDQIMGTWMEFERDFDAFED